MSGQDASLPTTPERTDDRSAYTVRGYNAEGVRPKYVILQNEANFLGVLEVVD